MLVWLGRWIKLQDKYITEHIKLIKTIINCASFPSITESPTEYHCFEVSILISNHLFSRKVLSAIPWGYDSWQCLNCTENTFLWVEWFFLARSRNYPNHPHWNLNGLMFYTDNNRLQHSLSPWNDTKSLLI